MDKKPIILLDAGHGGMIDGKYQTPGKRSPKWGDGQQYFEGVGNRQIREILYLLLIEAGYKVHKIADTQEDVSLGSRVREVNAHCNHYGSINCLFISIHSNGFSKESARGWSVYTTVGETKSDMYATRLYTEAKKMWPKEKFRKDLKDGDPDKESNFYVIKKTYCPAILSENFFHTNERECKKYLLSEIGRIEIAEVHFNMINNY
jgi:N-acetylmuramoyl-L-alanine amidase